MITLKKYMSNKVSRSPISEKYLTNASKEPEHKSLMRHLTPAGQGRIKRKFHQSRPRTHHPRASNSPEYNYFHTNGASSHYPSPVKLTAMNYILPGTSNNWRGQKSTANLENPQSSSAISPLRDLFREKRLTLSTSEENARIKRKLEEYDALSKKRYY